MSFTKKMRTAIYNLCDLKSLDRKASTRISADSPIVTLTTVPKRIGNIKPTIVSLLRQSLAPKEVHINIGADYFGDHPIPEFLNGLSVVKVQRVEKDLGPATKFIPTLQRLAGSDQLIVVLDDDMYYAPDLLQTLVSADRNSRLNPDGRTSFCVNGLLVPKNLESKSRPSDKEIKSGSKRVAIVEGCGGYTLRPSYVSAEQLLKTDGAPKRCLFDDDFWISGHLSRNGIVKVQIPAGRRKSLANTIESAISGDREALQTEMMRYFANDWKPEEYV